MKILLVSYYGWQFGGGETYLFELADALKENGHEVRLFASNNGADKYKLKNDYTFKKARTKFGWALSSLFNFRSLREFKKALNDFKPDIVHINSVSNETSPSVSFALKRYPAVFFVHSQYIFKVDKELALFKRIYSHVGVLTKKYLLHNINIYIVGSQSIAKSVPHNKQPIELCKLGIKPIKYEKIKNYNNLLFVGRLAKDKGANILLQAMPRITRNKSDLRLDIIGEGDELYTLKNIVKQHHLQRNVNFHGYLDKREINDYLKKTTLLVIPSLYEEPFGLVGIEAIFSGRPVVASAIGGIPEWLNPACGNLVKPGSPKELSETILKLLSSKVKLNQLSKSSHREAQQYSIYNNAQEITKLYRSVIKKYQSIR